MTVPRHKFNPRAPHIMFVIERVAKEHLVPVKAILGRSRIAHLSEARRRAIVQVKKELPALSSVQMGLIFNRDHATILYILGREAAAKNPGKAE